MNAWTAADHPRGDGGRFKTKARTEPEARLEAEPVVSTRKVFQGGAMEWRTDEGKLHREDGPALVRADGREQWWLHGRIHRIGGPAATDPFGTTIWCIEGKLHREDGPAVAHLDGRLQWWENGVRKPPEVEAALSMMWRARTPEDV